MTSLVEKGMGRTDAVLSPHCGSSFPSSEMKGLMQISITNVTRLIITITAGIPRVIFKHWPWIQFSNFLEFIGQL